MRADIKKAVSFILALALCMTWNFGYTMAAEQDATLTGTQARVESSGIARISNMSIVDGPQGKQLSIAGEVVEVPDVTTYQVGVLIISPENNTASMTLDIEGTTTFTDLLCDPPRDAGLSSGVFSNGVFQVYVYETYTLTDNSDDVIIEKAYKVACEIQDGKIVGEEDSVPPWEDIHEDYELTASPQAMTMQDYTYGEVVADVQSLILQNSGWKTLTNINTMVSGTGVSVSSQEAIDILESGKTAYPQITQDLNMTPGAYSAEIWISADQISTVPALLVPVSFTVKKATQGAVEGVETVAATTKGGLGKIAGLVTSSAYEVFDGENYTTWTALVVEEGGFAWVSPGAYQIRLAGNEFYEPGETTESIEVLDFYGFDDFEITEMKAGVPTDYDVTQHVSGGDGEKTYTIVSGNLPHDLELTTAGKITGTAFVVTNATITLELKVTDSVGATRSALMSIRGIEKGEQVTPESISPGATDSTVSIDNWSSESQAYAISTNGALEITEVTGWTTFGALEAAKFEGLKRNTQYYVYTYLPETEWLKPSPMISTAAKTNRTSLASISISGSGIVGEAVTAIVSPSGATVNYRWLDENGHEIADATSAAFTPSDAYSGKVIYAQAEGTGDFDGAVSSAAFLVGGTKVMLSMDVYHPGVPIEALLTAQEDGVSFAAISTTASGVGKASQEIKIERVNPGKTYDLLLKKPGQTDLLIRNIEVKTTDVSVTVTNEMKMYCGDFNGDNSIRLEDRAMLLQNKFYGKAVSSFSGEDGLRAAMLDLDGDGYIKLSDLAILMTQENYGKDAVVIDYAGN